MSTRPYHIDGSYSGLHQSVVSIADRSILDEASFRRMLSLEMKRAQRSQKPFLLSSIRNGNSIRTREGARNPP